MFLKQFSQNLFIGLFTGFFSQKFFHRVLNVEIFSKFRLCKIHRFFHRLFHIFFTAFSSNCDHVHLHSHLSNSKFRSLHISFAPPVFNLLSLL